jgi:hypothetical protein
MPSLTIDIPHALGKEEARRRIAVGFDRMRQQMTGGLSAMVKFQDRWDADRLHFEGIALGQKITGRLDVNGDTVQVQLDLPEFLAAIADRIRRNLQEQGRQLLEKQ